MYIRTATPGAVKKIKRNEISLNSMDRVVYALKVTHVRPNNATTRAGAKRRDELTDSGGVY